MANVKEIEWQGGIYNIADETARGAAQNALSAAQTAQATGVAAQTSANNAQTAADAAQATANAAQTAADNAQSTANTVSGSFNDYKELESETVSFGQGGIVVFKKRGNVCQISIRGGAISPGTYTVPIPQGFVPLSDIFEPGFLLSWGGDITGYWSISATAITLHVPALASVNAQQVFLM